MELKELDAPLQSLQPPRFDFELRRGQPLTSGQFRVWVSMKGEASQQAEVVVDPETQVLHVIGQAGP